MKDLAIVILNYNTYEMTLDLVNSLGRICPKDSCSIIVVDNASPNESAQILQENALKTNLFTFIKSEKNVMPVIMYILDKQIAKEIVIMMKKNIHMLYVKKRDAKKVLVIWKDYATAVMNFLKVVQNVI